MFVMAPSFMQSVLPLKIPAALAGGFAGASRCVVRTPFSRRRQPGCAIMMWPSRAEKRIEIVVGDGDQVLARNALSFRHHALHGRMRRQIRGIPESAVSLCAGSHADAWVAFFARDTSSASATLRSATFSRSVTAALPEDLFERAEVSRVLRNRVEVAPLDLAECLGRLPDALARPPNHRVLSLPISGC